MYVDHFPPFVSIMEAEQWSLELWTTRTQDNSYPRQLAPRTTRTQDNSYPRRLVPKTTGTQDNSYPGQLVPNSLAITI